MKQAKARLRLNLLNLATKSGLTGAEATGGGRKRSFFGHCEK
jgi:hypothetical protein